MASGYSVKPGRRLGVAAQIAAAAAEFLVAARREDRDRNAGLVAEAAELHGIDGQPQRRRAGADGGDRRAQPLGQHARGRRQWRQRPVPRARGRPARRPSAGRSAPAPAPRHAAPPRRRPCDPARAPAKPAPAPTMPASLQQQRHQRRQRQVEADAAQAQRPPARPRRSARSRRRRRGCRGRSARSRPGRSAGRAPAGCRARAGTARHRTGAAAGVRRLAACWRCARPAAWCRRAAPSCAGESGSISRKVCSAVAAPAPANRLSSNSSSGGLTRS